jgi:hypothetical protein
MKTRTWLMPVVFLATTVPTVLVLHKLEIGGDMRLMIALVVGVAATALAQTLLARREDDGGD